MAGILDVVKSAPFILPVSRVLEFEVQGDNRLCNS